MLVDLVSGEVKCVFDGLKDFLMEGQNEVFWFSLAIGTVGGLVFSLVGVFWVLPVLLWKANSNQQVPPKTMLSAGAIN